MLTLALSTQTSSRIDTEFAAEESKFRTLEKSSNALQKEAKNYLDSIRGMTAAQARLAETIDSFYGDNSDAAMSAHSYRRAVGELESKTARELDAPYRATVLEPVGKMCSYWPEINKAIEKRNKKVCALRLCPFTPAFLCCIFTPSSSTTILHGQNQGNW